MMNINSIPGAGPAVDLLSPQRIVVVDSHTGGEPTRVVVEGGPDLGQGPLSQRRDRFKSRFDHFRSAVVNEPRGSEVVVGALCVEPEDPTCAAGVIFFNNVGYLGMCGHGTIGLVVTLAHLGRIRPGAHRIETPVGVVTATLHEDGQVSVANVPSYRTAKGVTVEVPGIGPVTGDVAWGGNWFFLAGAHGQALTLDRVEPLTDFTWRIRQAVNAQGFPEVDHVELFGPPAAARRAGPQLRALPRQGLRPLALRHRHQRQAGLPGRRRQARGGRALGAGEHHRQHVHGSLPPTPKTAGSCRPSRARPSSTRRPPCSWIERDPFCWGIRP